MTMSVTPRIVEAIGNGVATSYSFGTARIFAVSHLVVTINGVVKTLGADYSVVGGNVIFTSPPADGAAVKIASRIPMNRDTDFAAAGRSTPAQIDQDIDRLTAIVQEEAERITAAENDIDGLQTRMTDAEERLESAEDRIETAEERLDLAADQFVDEVANRQSADANLQSQLSGHAPLEASAFSPISWHKQSIDNSVNIPADVNAWSFGPTMEIAEGQQVEIGANSVWTIANGQQGENV